MRKKIYFYLYQSTPNGFSGNLILDSMSPVDNDSWQDIERLIR
jgi:hypothetical protein